MSRDKWGIGFKAPPQERNHDPEDNRFCGVYGKLGTPERWPTRELAQEEADRLIKYWQGRGSEVTYWVIDLEEAGYG